MPTAIQAAIKKTEDKIAQLRAEAKTLFDKYMAEMKKSKTPEKQQQYLRRAIRVVENTETMVGEAKQRLALLKAPTAKKKRL